MAFKLTIDIEPSYILFAGQSLYRCLTRKAWESIRQPLLQKYQFRCALCGADEKGLNCHEVWSFSVENKTRKLVEVLPLCKMCHAVRHMDSPRSLREDLGFGYEKMKEHFLRVNGCTLEEFDEYYRQHQREVESLVYPDTGKVILSWRTDYGEYTSILAQPGNLKKGHVWEDGLLISVGF